MNEVITSRNNLNIKYAKKLLSLSSFRKEEGAFAIEGVRLCADAINSGVEVRTVFYTKKCLDKFHETIFNIIDSSQKNFEVSEDVMKCISDTDTPQGIVCICKIKILQSEIDYSKSLILLENIQNPSNLGSIFRTCDALGLKNVVISGNSCDIYNPKVLRGSMGAIFRLNVKIEENFLKFLSDLKNKNYKIYATAPSDDAEILGKEKIFSKKCAVVFGNEGNGITEEIFLNSDAKLTIPMNSNAESLNVSTAVGIIVWEMIKGGLT